MFLMAIIPAFLYAAIIYFSVPKNMISLSRSRRYLIAGLLAPSLMYLINFLFPNWNLSQSKDVFTAFFIYAFIQVGLLEEFTKYLTFQWVSSERISEKYDLPIATMFYSMMASIGFAIVENISYLINTRNMLIQKITETMSNGIKLNPFEVQRHLSDTLMNSTFNRGISAVLVHMLFGIVMGFFLSKAQQVKHFSIDSENELLIYSSKFKRWLYVALAIFSAAIFHGLYDLNWMLPDNTWAGYSHYVYIIAGIVLAGVLIKRLINKSKELKKTFFNKTEQNEIGG